MPRFDSLGNLISGVGSGVVAVNKGWIADGGVANWLADGVAIYQDSRDNGLYTKMINREPVKVSAQGANALAAGGGRWIAWLGFGGLYGPNGIIDPHGRLAGTSQEQDGRGAASPDGHIAITDSENRGFRVIAPNGVVTLEVTNTAAMSLHLVDGHRAVWSDQNRQPRARGLPSPAIPPFDVFAIRAVQVGTEWFVLAGTHTGLVLYPWHSAEFGWTLDGFAFYPAAYVIGSVVHVAYSHGAGELPNELDEWMVDVVHDPMVPLGSAPEPPDPEPPDPEPPMPPISDQTATVAAVRAKYPTPLGDQHDECLIEIAQTIGQGAGLLKKDSGTFITLDDGTRVAQDIICFPDGHIYDCLGDAENTATPQWGDAGFVEASRYYAVSAEPGPDPEPPIPEPPPNGDVMAEILYELRRLNYHLGVRP